ncbi:AraC family transcriptional regulator [Mucilaginibacter limnophilus]|uniref:AraC family transcriptional regulator n=1 Tax=Mucilaginibacter limnophilus TaxID=1932778 RepID=A0A437MRS1_9SPHI|nr:AraC family transcriptional regulator [Mucilaginibacter limnophilus]RVU00337.1 AraC family transcriptional regulator [Mucilaginibacter limnophilus]
MDNGFRLKFIEPDKTIADYVESIGMFHNQLETEKEVVVIPDGRIDLFFWKPASQSSQVLLIGLETLPEQRFVPPHTLAFVISFKPIAVEYILKEPIADIINSAKNLPDDFWNFNADDLNNFDSFYRKAVKTITSLLPKETDRRKQKLFELIYSSNGEMSVAELAEKSAWSSRQINRYFNQQYGLSLKAYCNILRFRASLEHLAHGKLFPELNFTDQAHFIKAVKKFSGVVPKELVKNTNDRFLLLSVLKHK